MKTQELNILSIIILGLLYGVILFFIIGDSNLNVIEFSGLSLLFLVYIKLAEVSINKIKNLMP